MEALLAIKPIKNPEIKRTQLFINNEYVDCVSGKTFESVNPATEETICMVQEGDKADVDKAVAAARAAMKRNSPWRKMNPGDRGKILGKFADIMERDCAMIGTVEVIDNGKPFLMALLDIFNCANIFRYYAGYCDKIEGRTLAMEDGKMGFTKYDPVGVVGAITPWNYPFAMSCVKLAQCMCAGNAVVMKPPELTPLTTLMMGDMAIEAGFPPGQCYPLKRS
ncbi:retinaldehyde dehydrogenase 3-like, partial [Convolutriloba macropyga]|uniref:retinaldehyde dehydrogenase 3-like n=1 Tax=Convolutriloba macropyga TaxID=536237 RepID=UPI003F51C211